MNPATWTYRQATGELCTADGEIVETCYSGHGKGVNNPTMEAVRSVGPIPKGLYAVGKIQDTPNLGPRAFPLLPVEHNALGRSGFWVHGDNTKGNRSGSHGCIIASRATRIRMAKESKLLEVV